MTTALYPGAPEYTVNGTGPYAIGHEYTSGAIHPMIRAGAVLTALTADDFTLTPQAGESGNLFLTAAAAAAHAGAKLLISRQTIVEQGWQGIGGAREIALEAQLDRHAQAIQENAKSDARALRVSSGTVPAFVPEDGKAILWSEPDGAFVPGPTADQIENAQLAAATAVDAAGAAVEAAETAESVVTRLYPRTGWLVAEGSGGSFTIQGSYTDANLISLTVDDAPQRPQDDFSITVADGNTTIQLIEAGTPATFPKGAMVQWQAAYQLASYPGAPDGLGRYDLTFESYVAANAAEIPADAAAFSMVNKERVISYVRDGGGKVIAPGDTGNWAPSDGRLNLLHCGSASDLASDFAGIMAQAAQDAYANGWTLVIPKGDWETDTVQITLTGSGRFDMVFEPGAKLIGPAHWQHFTGNGTSRAFTLTEWAGAGDHIVEAMYVMADGTVVPLRNSSTTDDTTNVFTRSGTGTLGSTITVSDNLGPQSNPADRPDAPPEVGGTIAVSRRHSILELNSDLHDVSWHIHGGEFDNAVMGYVAERASGTCVDVDGAKGLHWTGAPVFRGDPLGGAFADILRRRGDSGLVLMNCQQANIYDAQFLHQPDLGNYTTGNARDPQGPVTAPDNHVDDGFNINLIGCHAVNCLTAYRSSRNGGSYSLLNCSVTECDGGFIAANVSSDMPTARNIRLTNFHGRKIANQMLDVRDTTSFIVNGLTVEDFGRKPGGAAGSSPLFALNELGHAHMTGIVVRFEDQDDDGPKPDQVVFSFAGGRTNVDKCEARIEFPYDAGGNGAVGVMASSGLGSQGVLNCEMTMINVERTTSELFSVVLALPASGNTGQVVYLQPDDQFYTWTGSWDTIPAPDRLPNNVDQWANIKVVDIQGETGSLTTDRYTVGQGVFQERTHFTAEVNAGSTANAIDLKVPFYVKDVPGGVTVEFEAADTNTGPTTVTLNGELSGSLRLPENVALSSGYVIAGDIIKLIADEGNTNWYCKPPVMQDDYDNRPNALLRLPAFGLGATSTNSLDGRAVGDMLGNGWHSTELNTADLPAGVSASGHTVIVARYGALRVTQMLFDHDNSTVYTRSSTDNGSTWGVWAKMVQAGSLATVQDQPELLFENMGTAVAATAFSHDMVWSRQGNEVKVTFDLRVNLTIGGTDPTGWARISFDNAGLPDIDQVIGGEIEYWHSTNPDAANIGLTSVNQILITDGGTSPAAISLLAVQDVFNTQVIDASHFVANGDALIRTLGRFTYLTDDL